MELEFTDEQLGLREAARTVLDKECPPSLVRSLFEGGGDRSGLWSTLVGLDWPGLGLPAEHGGVGLGFVEVGILVEELGRCVAPGPFLATVTQYAPLLAEAGATDRLAAVAAGEVTGALAVAESGRYEIDAVTLAAERSGTGWVLRGTKSHVVDGATADEIAVVARGEAGPGAFLVPGDAVEATPLDVIDPTVQLATLKLDGVEVAADRVLIEPGDPAAGRAVTRAVEVATAAWALSTVATCRKLFETTVQYAKDREQFGKPIGSFQALKHRLADCYLAVERAAAVAWYAALTVAEEDERRPVAVSMAAVAAGDCARLLAHDGLQLHGGIGFTWENDLHFWLKRAATGELLWGTSAFHRARLAWLLGLDPAREMEL